MKLKDFKSEFRLMCSDTWGSALDAHFEAVGHLYNRGVHIPQEWAYSPGLGDPTDEDSYFYKSFEESTDEELLAIGWLMFRYLGKLKYLGYDY